MKLDYTSKGFFTLYAAHTLAFIAGVPIALVAYGP
jgi:hypothetical protein